MKKIKEQKTLYYTLILLISTILSGFLLWLTNSITEPFILEREKEVQLQTYTSLVDNIDDFEVLINTDLFEATLAYDKDGDTIAVMYISSETNSYGDVTIGYSVDTSGKILQAMFLEYDQTASLKGITEENLNLFIGLNLGDVPSTSDLTSGATASYQSIVSSFSKGKDHFETLSLAPADPFSVLAVGYAYKDKDMTFTPTDHVINKEIIYNENNDILGHVYTLFGSGPYQDGGDDKDIQFYVAVDGNNIILGVLVLDEEYDHSGGVFFTRIQQYINSFKGQSIQTLSYDVDWVSGATSGNSKTLVDTLMQALVEVIS